VNKILENARTGKLIGSSLDAKVYLYTENTEIVSKLKELSSASNDADALHRLFITSQVRRGLHIIISLYLRTICLTLLPFCRWRSFHP
jgi:hypothetical protein